MKEMDLTRQIEDILSRAGNYVHGRDSEYTDLTYDSISEWKAECGLLPPSAAATATAKDDADASAAQQDGREDWYKTGYDYWESESNCPPTVDGVLGGFAVLSKRDLEGSARFLRDLKASVRPELRLATDEDDGVPTRACECGAGEKSSNAIASF